MLRCWGVGPSLQVRSGSADHAGLTLRVSLCRYGADVDVNHHLTPGSGRSPGEGNGLPTPVFWPGEFHGEEPGSLPVLLVFLVSLLMSSPPIQSPKLEFLELSSTPASSSAFSCLVTFPPQIPLDFILSSVLLLHVSPHHLFFTGHGLLSVSNSSWTFLLS